MSSIITIGFLDRTRVCIQAEFSLPLADDERREILIHAVLLTARAFAALPPQRQPDLSAVLKKWAAERFTQCPVQVVAGDPQACAQRFASTFLTPVREYALATAGCDRELGAIEYFLPMAAAAFLRHVASSVGDADETLGPALALCGAVAIHPITIENHFQMAIATLPKTEPITERPAAEQPPLPLAPPEKEGSEKRTSRGPGTRSLIVSAVLAALAIIGMVQYLSRREPPPEPVAHAVPAKPVPKTEAPPPVTPPQKEAPPAPVMKPADPAPIVAAPRPRASAPLSPQARAYLRKVRDLAENSLAQVEVMLSAAGRQGISRGDLEETLDHGARQVQTWRRQFSSLSPPRALTAQHREVGRLLSDISGIARGVRTANTPSSAEAHQQRLVELHDRLDQVLTEAEAC